MAGARSSPSLSKERPLGSATKLLPTILAAPGRARPFPSVEKGTLGFQDADSGMDKRGRVQWTGLL
jgi:hypothetical protein